MINTSKISRLLAPLTPLTAALLTTALAATPAAATWSILITDTRTGEFVLGSATCLTGFDLARETPLVLTGIGAITAQSSVDSAGRNRMFVRDRLLEGQPLNQILAELAINDPGHDNRQYGMITTTGDSLTYSGPQNANWAGGITGRIEQGRPGPADDIVYAVQGNILSGPNVVDDAVDAIINTDSDLPGKLMAAMLAARVAGGDGRCSCSNNNPTGCGSPPPAPFKSAHVGYMIGSRADDTDSIRAFYELPATATALTQLGNNLIAVATDDGLIELYTNATNTGDQVSHLNKLTTIEPQFPLFDDINITSIFHADLDNNGLEDLVIVNDHDCVMAHFQTEPGTFSPITTIVRCFPNETVIPYDVPDYPGTQIMVFGTPPLYSHVYTLNKDQSFSKINNNEYFPAFVADAIIQDLNNDSIPDLVFVSSSFTQVRYQTGRADGQFPNNPTLTLDTSDFPRKLRLVDINNDNLTDILVATIGSGMIDAFINTGTPSSPTFTPKISSPIAAPAIDFTATDLNNDGLTDLAVLFQSGPNLRYYLGDGNGNFTETDRTRIGGVPTNALLADLNNDGDQDLITTASDKLLIYDNLNNATVQRQTGFARGDKFMFINVANQFASADDPVDQMLTRFEDFRATLINKVDAVQTTVTTPSRVLIDNQGSTPTIRIELRDYQSNLLVDPATFTLHYNPANLTPGLPTKLAPGIYTIPISAPSNPPNPGNHSLKIQATINNHPDAKPVTLMPSLTISTTTNLADFNADTALNFLDISIFINALIAHNPAADLNNDTLFDQADITLFINAYTTVP